MMYNEPDCLSVQNYNLTPASSSAVDSKMVHPVVSGAAGSAKPMLASDTSSGYSSSMRSSNSSPPTSRANSPIAKSERSNTPPTPPSSEYYKETIQPIPTKPIPTKIQPIPTKIAPSIASFTRTDQDDFLQLVEPNPVSPPDYTTLPPGGCPKYPIYDPALNNDGPIPAYTPSIYKIGVVAKKVEWLTPYEPAPTRSWKNVIMELNSTQLNFYHIPSALESHLMNFKPISQSPARTYNEFEAKELSYVNSYLTSDSDLQFFKFCSRLNLLSDTVKLDEEFDPKVAKKSKKLLRSYSLQRSRIGLATDYKKRPNVLRLRLESEQLLIHFPSIRELVEWNMALGVGRDVSLDLNERELPHFRTVPRRRRDRSASSSAIPSSSMFRGISTFDQRNRNRSNSEPNSTIKGKLSKLKSKLSTTSIAANRVPDPKTKTKQNSGASLDKLNTTPRVSNLELARLNLNSQGHFALFDDVSRSDMEDSNYEDEDDEYYDDEEALELVARTSLHTAANRARTRRDNENDTPRDYDEDDIQNMSDLHHSDDEDEDEEDDELDEEILEDLQETGISTDKRKSKVKSPSKDHKWEPLDSRAQSKRKFYRNCMRCIKPLTMDDSWVNKSLCRPTTMSPLNFAYLRVKYCNSAANYSPPSTFSSFFSNSSSSSSLASMNSNGGRKKSFSTKEINGLNLPDSALTKVPNHFLKEYVVGSHGLIPKEV